MQSNRHRSYLFAPGDDEKKLVKAACSAADCVIFELEDGVALHRKAEARATVARMMRELDVGDRQKVLRVNALGTPFFEEDMAVCGQARPDVLMLPKVEQPQEIVKVAAKLDALHCGARMIVLIETPLGCMNLREIAQAHPRLQGLVFGAEDYAAAAGAIRTRSGHEVQLARSMIAMAAAAYDLQAIDQVYTDFTNEAGLADDCKLGRELGYGGKMVIHPRQIETVNAAFAPTLAELEYAKRVLSSFEEASARGAGAFSLDGKMIDAPVIKQAKRILLKT